VPEIVAVSDVDVPVVEPLGDPLRAAVAGTTLRRSASIVSNRAVARSMTSARSTGSSAKCASGNFFRSLTAAAQMGSARVREGVIGQ